jgi:hypothetical protein
VTHGGTCEQRPSEGEVAVRLSVLYGTLAVRRLELAGFGTVELSPLRVIAAGETGAFAVTAD